MVTDYLDILAGTARVLAGTPRGLCVRLESFILSNWRQAKLFLVTHQQPSLVHLPTIMMMVIVKAQAIFLSFLMVVVKVVMVVVVEECGRGGGVVRAWAE